MDTIRAISDEADVLGVAGGTRLTAADMRQLRWDLEQHSVQLIVVPSLNDISWDRIRIRPVGGLPLLFRQSCVGRDGCVFSCLKLRTMVIDAEDLLADLHANTGYVGVCSS